MYLKTKVLQGFFWNLTQQFGIRITMIMVTIFLARILDPEDFGLIGMLAVFIALGNSLIEAGMTSSLIRTKNADDRDFSTVFYINLIIGILVYALMFTCAGMISVFFNQPVLEQIIKIYCLNFIILPFSAVQRTRLVRKMDFKTELKVTLPSIILGGILGIFLALQEFGVWALVWMNLCQNFLMSIQFWIQSKWRPSWIFDWEKFRHHFSYGAYLTLASVINSVFSNIYHLVIGKFFPVTQVGYYSKADSLKQIPVNNISNALARVTFPMFSEIQDDKEKLKSAYKRIIQQVIFWLTPVMVLSAVLAEPLFRILLTEKWIPAVPYFQILCFVGLMFPIHSYNLNILKVKGRSDLYLKLEIIKSSLLILGIFIALPFGIFGLLWNQVIFNLVSFGINSYYSGKFIGYNIWYQTRDIFPIFSIGAFAGFVSWFSGNLIQKSPLLDWLQLFTGGFAGILVYFLISWKVKSEPFLDFKKIILKRSN